jgi:hypothetical protein
MIRNLVAKGTPEALQKADRLAITPGVLKKTQAGSQIKHLGAGMEGVSTLTAHPKRGLGVRKIIDPKGIAGPGMVAQREAAGRALQNSRDVAKFRGATNTPGGLRAQNFDYVPPAKGAPSLAAGTPAQSGEMSTAIGSGRGRASAPALAAGTGAPAMDQTRRAQLQMKRLKMQGQQHGFKIQDLHEGNMMAGADGSSRAVDFMAVPSSKTPANFANSSNLAKAENTMAMAEVGQRTPYLDYLEDPRRPGNVMARAYRKAPPLTPGSSTALRQNRQITPRQARPAASQVSRPPGEISTAVGSGKRRRPIGPAAAMAPKMSRAGAA